MESSTPSGDTAWAMSQENVELIKGILSAYEGLDLAAFWRDTDPADMRAIFEAVYDPAMWGLQGDGKATWDSRPT